MNESNSNNSGKYLVIVAHPDDAELGSGGSVARWVREGSQVSYIICTTGNKGSKDLDMTPHRLAEIREKEQEAASKVLGVNKVLFLRHQDGELEASLAFRNQLSLLIRSFQPDVILTHDPWRHYLIHPDHRAVGISVMDAVVSARDHLFVPEQFAVGINHHEPSEMLFTFPDEPDFFVDITDTFELKMEAICQHKSQVKISPHWSYRVREWAEANGRKNGCKYAEAFKRIQLKK